MEETQIEGDMQADEMQTPDGVGSAAGQVSVDGAMKLGGGIELIGFADVDKAHLVVVKKMVGNYAKDMSEKSSDFEKLVVELKNEGGSYSIHSEMTAGGNQLKSDSSDKNLFMSLNNSLKGIMDKQ